MDYRILPPAELPEAEITLPRSKSMSNRALIINALAGFASPMAELAECDDTRVLADALASTDAAEINIDGSGTAMRFLTAYFARCEGRTVTLTGNSRMARRPVGPLVDALRSLGAEIEYVGAEGFPPLKITGRRLHGGRLEVDASMSSQFVSALLLIAPYLEGGLVIELLTDIGSLPYVDLTLAMMRAAGVEAVRERLVITAGQGAYRRPVESVEADWSAASYWYEIEAVSSGFITLLGLEQGSPQGDAAVARIFSDICVLTEFDDDCNGCGPAAELMASPDISPRLTLDLADHPDLAPAIAVTCALVGIPFRLTGLASLKIKECDRLEALRAELSKLGVTPEIIGDDIFEWTGRRTPLHALPEFDTHGDHRMAMALAPVALYVPGIKIRNAEVVTKSYPAFWDHLQAAGFTLVDGDVSYEQLFDGVETEAQQ